MIDLIRNSIFKQFFIARIKKNQKFVGIKYTLTRSQKQFIILRIDILRIYYLLSIIL